MQTCSSSEPHPLAPRATSVTRTKVRPGDLHGAAHQPLHTHTPSTLVLYPPLRSVTTSQTKH